VYILKMIL